MKALAKWVLIGIPVLILLGFAGESAGLNVSWVAGTLAAVLQKVGLLILLFTGSAAAIEVAKYYQQKNRLLAEQQEEGRASEV